MSLLILKKIWEFFKPAAVPLLVVACLYFWVNNITSNITNISEDVTNRIEKIQEIHDEEMKKVLDANRQERIEHENNIKKLQNDLDISLKRYEDGLKELEEKKKAEIIGRKKNRNR